MSASVLSGRFDLLVTELSERIDFIETPECGLTSAIRLARRDRVPFDVNKTSALRTQVSASICRYYEQGAHL